MNQPHIDFQMINHLFQTMSTAVIQLFTTEAPAHSVWIKRLSGIACFVKDSSKRSYFIRVYCMLKHSMIWEEEMYETISMNKPREFMITFEGQVMSINSGVFKKKIKQ